MNDLNNILEMIKKTCAPPKILTIEGTDIEVELEILNSQEEANVLVACKDVDGTAYMEAVKRYTLAYSIKKFGSVDLRKDDIDYKDSDDKPVKKSKFLYMNDFLGRVPSPVIDALFEAYTDKVLEVTKSVKEKFKFDKFYLSEELPEEKPDEFRRLGDTETINTEELDEDEKLRLQVEKEEQEELQRRSASEQG